MTSLLAPHVYVTNMQHTDVPAPASRLWRLSVRRIARTGHERDLDISIFESERASARRHWIPISRSESEEHALEADIHLPLLVRATCRRTFSLSAAQSHRIGGLRPGGRKIFSDGRARDFVCSPLSLFTCQH